MNFKKTYLYRANALKSMQQSTQEAVLEMSKSGRTEKMSNLELRQSDIQESVDKKSEKLNNYVAIALHALAGFGTFVALTCTFFIVIDDVAETEEKVLTDHFDFLIRMLENEHR